MPAKTSNLTNRLNSTTLNSVSNLAKAMPEINSADTLWMLVSTALVFIMIPGVAFFYGGNVQHKNKLSILFSGFIATAVVTIEWFLFGYSLSFSETGSKLIGDFKNAFLIGVDGTPNSIAPTVPSNVFMIYQCMFACVTAALSFGGAVERATLRGYVVFLVVWFVVVYAFVANWVWSINGWIHTLGALDYAGGTPVHIVSGFSGLAYALFVGPRNMDISKLKPTSVSKVFTGTALLWFGWFGFNGGSEFALNSRAINAVIVTHISACTGGVVWVFTEMLLRRSRKMSLFDFCNGAVAGLVAITPAAGFVTPVYSFVFGGVAAVCCCLACKAKRHVEVDDACDVFSVHGVGGIIGCVLTGVFAQNKVATMSGGAPIPGGLIDGNWMLVFYQLAGAIVGILWSFLVTYSLLFLINLIPIFKLRMSERDEKRGADLADIGETETESIQTP